MVGMTDVAPISSHPAGQLADKGRTIWTDQLQDDRGGGQEFQRSEDIDSAPGAFPASQRRCSFRSLAVAFRIRARMVNMPRRS